MKVYQWILELKDKATDKMDKVTAAAGLSSDKIDNLQRKMKGYSAGSNEVSGSLTGLRDAQQRLLNQRDLIDASDINKIRVYNTEIKNLGREINKLETVNGSKFKTWAKDAFANIPGSGLISNPLVMAGAAFGAVTKMALNFEEGMAKVNATAQLTKPQLQVLEKQLLTMGKRNGADMGQLPLAFENILSATNDIPLSMQIMEQSLKGAKAAFTDVNVVGNATARVLSIVGAQNTNAAKVMDTLFAAKRMGAGEFQDFANYIPGAVAAGDALGLKLGEVAGAFSYFTAKGQGASETAMYLQNAFSALGKSDITKGLKAAGVDVFDNGKIRPLLDIVSDLKQRMAGLSNEQRSVLMESAGLKDVQARNAFNILTSDVGKLRETILATVNSTGEMDKALAASGTTSRTWADTWARISGAAIEFGNKILPFVNIGLDATSKALKLINDYGPYIVTTLGSIGGAFLIANAGAVGSAIGFNVARAAAWGFNGTLTAIKMNLRTLGIGLVIEGVVLLGAYLWETYDKSQKFRASLAGIAAVAGVVGEVFMGVGKQILGGLTFSPALIASGAAQMGSAFAKIGKMSMSGIYNEGYDALVKAEAAAGAKKKKQEKNIGAAVGLAGMESGFNIEQKSTVENISSGGAKPTNIYITVEKFQDSIQIHTTNIKEGINDTVAMLEEALTRVVNGVNATAYE